MHNVIRNIWLAWKAGAPRNLFWAYVITTFKNWFFAGLVLLFCWPLVVMHLVGHALVFVTECLNDGQHWIRNRLGVGDKWANRLTSEQEAALMALKRWYAEHKK